MLLSIPLSNGLSNLRRFLCLFASAIVLSACTGNFAKDSVCESARAGCVSSMHDINARASAGTLVLSHHSMNGPSDGHPIAWEPYPTRTPTAGDPLRVGDAVLRIWVAPYVDTADVYHDAAYISVVTTKGHWSKHPISLKKSRMAK